MLPVCRSRWGKGWGVSGRAPTPPDLDHATGAAPRPYPARSPLALSRRCPLFAERREILSSTKNIAVKAARRRSRVLESDRLQLLGPMKERSSLSLHSLSESEDPLSPETPASRGPPCPGLQHAASEDNLSSSTGETASRAEGPCPSHSPGPWLRGHKEAGKKLEKREESLDGRRRKRRSRSFEVTGHGVRAIPTPADPLGAAPGESLWGQPPSTCASPGLPKGGAGAVHLGMGLPLQEPGARQAGMSRRLTPSALHAGLDSLPPHLPLAQSGAQGRL